MASAAVATALAATVLAAPTTAWAHYSTTKSAALTVTADILAPATSVSFTMHCKGASGKGTVTVDWTASADAHANSYAVTLSTSSGTASSTSVSGHDTTEASLAVPRTATPYTLDVVAGYGNWTSSAASPSSTVSC